MTVTGRDETGAGVTDAPTPEPPKRSTGRRRRTGPPAPAARFEPGRVADTRHRNPTWIIAGVLLVLLSALGGVLLFTSTDDRAEVLVAAVDIDPGRAVVAGDLQIARVAADDRVRSIPAAEAAELVGQQTNGRIPAGTVLSPEMFDTAVALGPDEMVIGAALDPGEAPLPGLQIGDAVVLLDTAAPVADPAATVPGAPGARTIGTGSVWAVEPIATGQLWVSIRVDRSVGEAASSVAATDDALRIALIGGTP